VLRSRFLRAPASLCSAFQRTETLYTMTSPSLLHRFPGLFDPVLTWDQEPQLTRRRRRLILCSVLTEEGRIIKEVWNCHAISFEFSIIRI